jgi:hypothetical protein
MTKTRRRGWAAALLTIGAAAAVFLAVGDRFLQIDTDDGVSRADAVVVLAGTLNDDRRRVAAGVGLYAQGRVRYVILPLRHETFRWRWAVDTYGLKAIVPRIHLLVGHAGGSGRWQTIPYGGTYVEAQNTLSIMKAHQLKSAIIVTSAYHTRRARLIFERIGSSASLRFVYHPVGRSTDASHPWWLDAAYLKTVLNEYRKLIFAHFLYPDSTP